MKKLIALGVLFAAHAFAITGGPIMPEYAQFEETNASNLVDPASGNFTYAIPLLEVPGPEGTYPMALSYHSGIRYNQEASWVGLGWALNAGAINRILRGVPDDYFNSVVATRNVEHVSGGSVNVSLGYGPFGMSMAFDINSGQLKEVTQGITISYARCVGFGIDAGPQMTISTAGISVGIGVGLPIGTASYNLYNSASNGSTGFGFSPGIGGVSVSHASGSHIGVGAGEGVSTYGSEGAGVVIYGVSVYLGVSHWAWDLDESIVDYMNGYLFQDGKGAGFKNRVPLAAPYKAVAGTLNSTPRQRFERSKLGTALYPSSDFYQVSANGLSGSFQPYVEPGAASPVIVDGDGENNQGYAYSNPASFDQITFRMDGDQGYNLLHTGSTTLDGNQIGPDNYPYTSGTKTTRKQYGAYRIAPVFTTLSDGSVGNVLTGFIIRNADGITYEYKLPVYTLLQGEYAFKDPTLTTRTRMERMDAEKYATSWLLTAVKGADYLPSNSGSTAAPAVGDFGHWVKFTYTTPVTSNWSAPLTGNTPSDPKTASGYYNRTYGIKQLVYLKTIETQTHQADFELVDRVDVPKSKNSPISGGELTHDDGLVSTGYKNAVNDDPTFAQPFTNNGGAGGFPINWNNPIQSSLPETDVFAGSFTFTYPGSWYTQILQARGGKATGFNDDNEEIFGFHYKWSWLDQNVIPSVRRPNTTEPAFTGSDTVDRDCGVTNLCNHIYFKMNCPDIFLNSSGDTEVRCHFNMNSDRISLRDVKIYSAFINWPKLESLLPYGPPQALADIKVTEKANKKTLKEITFQYDYTLCNNLYPDHPGISALATKYASKGVYVGGVADDLVNKGKLTLKKVSVYGTGGVLGGAAAKLPDYEFTYQSGAANPNYGTMYQNDYWGMYSPMGSIKLHGVRQVNTAASGTPPNGGEQVGVAWNLQKIKMPSGGTISMDYQRDEYYYSGLAKDINSGKDFAIPDLFSADFAHTNNAMVFNKYYKLNGFPTSVKADFTSLLDPTKLRQINRNPVTNILPTSNLGPDGKDDFELKKLTTTEPADLKTGDMVAVVYQMEKVQANPANIYATKYVGMSNIAIVTRTEASGAAAKRVRLLPLVQRDASSKFFIYSNFMTNEGGIDWFFRFNYFLVPITNAAGKKFFGGDIAVKKLVLSNGFGPDVVKSYTYTANGRRNAQGTFVDNLPVSSGAMWALPDLASGDTYEKYHTDATILTSLHFDPWPYWCASDSGAAGHCENQNFDPSPAKYTHKNVLTDFLNAAYKPDDRVGGLYYPEANPSYSRTTEKLLESSTSTNALAGSTEYQHYNLASAFLNENGLGYSASTISKATDPWRISNWVVTSPTTNDKTVAGNLLALDGKPTRQYEINSNGKIIASKEYKYALTQPVYRDAASAPVTLPLGAVQQKYTSQLSDLVVKSLTMLIPSARLVEVTNMKDFAYDKTQYTNFDSKSGDPLVSIRRNSSGDGIAVYKIPEHNWDVNSQASKNNQLLLTHEERKYMLLSGATFDRNLTGDILGATLYRWRNIHQQKTATSMSNSTPFLYKDQTFKWDQELFDGFPNTSYTPLASDSDPAWVPEGPRVSLINQYGYPIEKTNDNTGVSSAEFTGFGSNLIIGRVSNAKWSNSSIYTCDYISALTGNTLGLDDLSGWKRTSSSTVVLTTSSKHYGAKVISFTSGAGLTNANVVINPLQKKVTVECNLKVAVGSVTISIQPYNSTATVGTAVTRVVNSTSWSSYALEIDLGQSQYSGATKLTVKILPVAATDGGFVEDIRIYPSGSFVNTFYYDPTTYKILAMVDANKSVKSFVYDARGRLTAVKNDAGQTVSTATYTDYN